MAAGALNINEASAASALELAVSAAGGRLDGSLTDEKQRPAATARMGEELGLWSWLDPSVLAPYEDQGKSVSIAARVIST